MTGEEIVQSLLDRISLKRARVGDFTLSLSTLEALLRDSLNEPQKKRFELGYPKRMTKPRVNDQPWVPKGPEPPLATWANDRREEEEAFAQGYRE